MSGDIQISPHVGELFVKYGVRRQYRSGEVLLEKGALSTGRLSGQGAAPHLLPRSQRR